MMKMDQILRAYANIHLLHGESRSLSAMESCVDVLSSYIGLKVISVVPLL